jgi:hypothetical protein
VPGFAGKTELASVATRVESDWLIWSTDRLGEMLLRLGGRHIVRMVPWFRPVYSWSRHQRERVDLAARTSLAFMALVSGPVFARPETRMSVELM